MRVLYVSDSATVSGAEIVLMGYVEGYRPPAKATHVFLAEGNRRLRVALDDRGVPHTTTRSYSRRLLRTTADPRAVWGFVRAFRSVSKEMGALIHSQRIDVVHAISYPASLYAAFACRASRVPQVWHEHNIKRIHAVNRYLYRFVASTCAWVVGPSDAVTGNLRSAGIAAAKLRTVYNGIDLRRFRIDDTAGEAVRRELGLGPQDRAIGLFGQFLPYKGHKTLIEAAPRVLAQEPRARFFFVGARENPALEAELQQAIAAAGLGDRFHFTGWRDDVAHVIRAMDAIVVATTTPEPAALALMETMAMGRPVVGSRTGGTAELVEHDRTGLLFTPGDAADLAASLSRLMTSPDLARTLGEAGRRRVQDRFTVDRHLQEMWTLYESAVGGLRR